MDLIAETFGTHQPKIAAYAVSSPAAMAHVYRFVLATIQQPLYQTPAIVRQFETMGSRSPFAFEVKARALDWLDERYESVYAVAMDIDRAYPDPAVCEFELMMFFAGLPGLGLIKAGFMVQLCFGLGGCLDRHNFARFGIPERTFDAVTFKRAKREATRRAKVAAYLEMTRACGGCALLWAEWCAYVAERAPTIYRDAEHVSALHCEALNIQ